MSVTQVEFPGRRNINGGEELGCSRWSFTRIRSYSFRDSAIHVRYIRYKLSFRDTHIDRPTRQTDPTEFPGHTHRPTDVGYTS